MAWTNRNLRVFHGTDDLSAACIAPLGAGGTAAIALSTCAALTDFGQGFYTTTYRHQARQWANQRVRRIGHGNATVLEFDIDRVSLGGLTSLVFVTDSIDFYDLVAYSRGGGAPHAPADFRRAQTYDVVYGPVSLWPQMLAIKDCDQVSFHTDHALGVLMSVVAQETGGPLF